MRGFDSVISGSITQADLARKSDGHLSGTSTGLTDLNNLLGGLHKSDLIILAGRPGMGKTALATNIAFHAAITTRTGETAVPVAFFSLEMAAEQLGTRILSERAQVDSEQIRRGKLNSAEFDQLVIASNAISGAPFFIDDTPSLSVSQLSSRARRLKRTSGLGLIIVDYLQLLTPQLGVKSENRVQEISNISRTLKAIAKDLNVPVLALSQLSRAVEMREDKRPNLADLRESGSIEQDADVVMFVYREEYYLNKREPERKMEESEDTLICGMMTGCAKCRIPKIRLRWLSRSNVMALSVRYRSISKSGSPILLTLLKAPTCPRVFKPLCLTNILEMRIAPSRLILTQSSPIGATLMVCLRLQHRPPQ